MKVRRIRYVPPYQVEDDNPFRDKDKPPKKFWRNWREIEVVKDADVRQLSSRHDLPGESFQLRIPMTDPETGRMRDADGDQAVLRIVMIGASMNLHGCLTFNGFVSKSELHYEENYRAGRIGDVLADDQRVRLQAEYVREEWQALT